MDENEAKQSAPLDDRARNREDFRESLTDHEKWAAADAMQRILLMMVVDGKHTSDLVAWRIARDVLVQYARDQHVHYADEEKLYGEQPDWQRK